LATISLLRYGEESESPEREREREVTTLTVLVLHSFLRTSMRLEQGVFLFDNCLYILLRHSGKKGCFQIFDLRTVPIPSPLSI
jgi:hypothetical protein